MSSIPTTFAEGNDPQVVEDDTPLGESATEVINDANMVAEDHLIHQAILPGYMADVPIETLMFGTAVEAIVDPTAEPPIERFEQIERIDDYVEYLIAMRPVPPFNFAVDVIPEEYDD